MKYKKWLFPILSAVVASVAVVAVWINIESKEHRGETVIRHIDYVDITSSIETLSNNVDVIVIGTVSDVVRSNSGGAVYRFDIEEILKGEVADSIHVVRTAPPWSTDIPPPYSELNVGERLALYMDRTSTTRYRPLVFDNGVFDVEVVDGDTILRPRGIHPDMFAEGTTFTMAEVRDAIGPDDEAGPVGSTQ